MLNEISEELPTTNLANFIDEQNLKPVGEIMPLLLAHKSILKDQFVEIKRVKQLIRELTQKKAIVRLNHVGFCYKVESQKLEQERLIRSINPKLHLYIEPSNDEGLWFFVGDTSNWKDPMIEMVPIEKTSDQRAEYWLPHVQIDIDTTLSENEIKKIVASIFGEEIKPFSIAIDGVAYIVRNRLGIIDGVNIMLDLATKSRDVEYTRKNILKQIA